MTVLCSSETVFEVRGNAIFVVNLASWSAHAGGGSSQAYPAGTPSLCSTGLGVLSTTTAQSFFGVESYQMTYSGMIFPIPDMDSVDFSAGAHHLPPPKQRTSDRPRRRRSNPNKISTLIRLCSRCKQTGHNKATCEAQF